MILLGVGCNLGDRAASLRRAAELLTAEGVHIEQVSSTIETPALLPPDAPAEWDIPFLNQVWRVRSALAPEALLVLVKRIEQAMGRQDRGRWGPREIDIDVLDMDGVVLDSPHLTLPHPGIAERRFVLEPLAEVAPAWRHPVTGKSAVEMLA